MTQAPHTPTREPRRTGFWLKNGDWVQYEAAGTQVVVYAHPPRKPNGHPDLSKCAAKATPGAGVL